MSSKISIWVGIILLVSSLAMAAVVLLPPVPSRMENLTKTSRDPVVIPKTVTHVIYVVAPQTGWVEVGSMEGRVFESPLTENGVEFGFLYDSNQGAAFFAIRVLDRRKGL